jgi:hypothetical protein
MKQDPLGTIIRPFNGFDMSISVVSISSIQIEKTRLFADLHCNLYTFELQTKPRFIG